MKIVYLFFLLALFFLLFPEVDLYISSLFFNGNGFFLKDNFLIMSVYNGVILISQIFVISIIILLLIDFFLKKEFIKRKILLYLLIFTILGPGIIVNGILKNNWGRARPTQIINFGGEKSFTPPFIKANQCKENCSFVCGHAASGFFLFAFIPFFRKNEKIITLSALTLGSFIGLIRIIQGGHFLSDVIFSGFFIYFTYKIVYFFMFKDTR